MGDPDRWLDPGGDSDELERALLASVRHVAPRPNAKNEAWDRIAVQVAAVAAVGTASVAADAAGVATKAVADAAGAIGAPSLGAALQAPVAAVGVATKAVTMKIVIGIALTGSTLAGGGFWARHALKEPATIAQPAGALSRPAPVPTAPAPPATESPAPLTVATGPCDPARPTAACPQLASARRAERPSKTGDDFQARNLLAVESSMLTEARAKLRNGDARGALALLEQLRARFPKGVLVQERDVLSIQVVAALGETSEARSRAKAFLAAYPSSPHAPQVRRFVEAP